MVLPEWGSLHDEVTVELITATTTRPGLEAAPAHPRAVAEAVPVSSYEGDLVVFCCAC